MGANFSRSLLYHFYQTFQEEDKSELLHFAIVKDKPAFIEMMLNQVYHKLSVIYNYYLVQLTGLHRQ